MWSNGESAAYVWLFSTCPNVVAHFLRLFQVCRIARKLKASPQKIEFRGFMDEAAAESAGGGADAVAMGADELDDDDDLA